MRALEIPDGVGVMPLGMQGYSRVLLLSNCTTICDSCARSDDEAERAEGHVVVEATRTVTRVTGSPMTAVAYETCFADDALVCEHLQRFFAKLVVRILRDSRGRAYPQVYWRNRGLTSAAAWPDPGVDDAVRLLGTAIAETTALSPRLAISASVAQAIAESAMRLLRARGYVLQGEWLSTAAPERVVKGRHRRTITG